MQMRRWMMVLLLGLCGACSGDDATDENEVSGLDYAVDSAGPFRVGYRTWEVTYSHPGSPEGRTIPVHVWYPTEDRHDLDGDPPTEYPIYINLFTDGQTIIDASPAASVYDGGYPVLAYSHGARGVAEGSYRLMRYFASHGWLGVSVGHVGDRLIDPESDSRQPLSHWLDRPLDMKAGVDALDNLEPSHVLAGLANTSQIVLTGHSRGTYTVWAGAGSAYDLDGINERCASGSYDETCTDDLVAAFSSDLADERVVAAMPTAGTGHGEFFDAIGGRASVAIPIFMMTASLDDVGAGAFFEELPITDASWVEIEGGCHELFNIGCGRSEDSAKFHIVTTYALAFARKTLLGDSSASTAAILDGNTVVSEFATLLSK